MIAVRSRATSSDAVHGFPSLTHPRRKYLVGHHQQQLQSVKNSFGTTEAETVTTPVFSLPAKGRRHVFVRDGGHKFSYVSSPLCLRSCFILGALPCEPLRCLLVSLVLKARPTTNVSSRGRGKGLPIPSQCGPHQVGRVTWRRWGCRRWAARCPWEVPGGSPSPGPSPHAGATAFTRSTYRKVHDLPLSLRFTQARTGKMQVQVKETVMADNDAHFPRKPPAWLIMIALSGRLTPWLVLDPGPVERLV
jgi:hypothetical protein